MRGLKPHDYELLVVNRLAVVVPVHGDGTNNKLALLLCLGYLRATNLALASTVIRN